MRPKKIIRFIFIFVLVLNWTTLISMAQLKQINQALQLGGFKVYKLQDGQTYLPLNTLSGIDPDEALKLSGGMDSVCIPINSYLIKTPNHTILVDAGAGENTGEDTGHLIEQLKEIGIGVEQVDIILITHFHFDHIGGLTNSDGEPVFPNATLYVPKAESDYWMRDLTMIPENQQSRASKYKSIFSPYQSGNRYKVFLPDDELLDGIKDLPAYGHTIGHTVYTITSNGEELWCIGDLIHFENIQFQYPQASVSFDYDAQKAIGSRIDSFTRAANTNVIVAASHLAKIIRLKTEKDRFEAIPIDLK